MFVYYNLFYNVLKYWTSDYEKLCITISDGGNYQETLKRRRISPVAFHSGTAANAERSNHTAQIL